MNYKLTDSKNDTFIIGSINCEIIDELKNCRCGFSWKNEKEAVERQESNHCIIMNGRKVDENETQILQSAWVKFGKEYYKTTFNLPRKIELIDIKHDCRSEKIIGRTYDKNGWIYGEINENQYPFPYDVK